MFYFQCGGDNGTTIVLFYGLFVLKITSDVTWVSLFPLFFSYSSNDTSFQLFLLIFVRHWTTEKLFLGCIPFFWMEIGKTKWYFHLLIIMFLSWEDNMFIAAILPLFFIYRSNSRMDVILFFIFSYTQFDEGCQSGVITIPILLSGVYWSRDGVLFTLLILLWAWIGERPTLMLFPVFWIQLDKNFCISSLFVIPIFAYSDTEMICWTPRRRFVFIPIPTVIILEDDNTQIISVIFSRYVDGQSQVYTLFICAFILILDKNYIDLWILAPCFRYQSRKDDNLKKYYNIFFLPTLTIYYKNENGLFISVLWLLIGYLNIEQAKRVWFLPFIFASWKQNEYHSFYYLAWLGSYSFENGTEKTRRSWLFPLYFYTHTYTDEKRISIFVWIFPIIIYKDPGGFLKKLFNGEFQIGDYHIKNHFLFLYFTISDQPFTPKDPTDLQPLTEAPYVPPTQPNQTTLILYGLIGSTNNSKWVLPFFVYTEEKNSYDYFIIPLLMRIKTGQKKLFAFYFGLLYWDQDDIKGEHTLLFFYIFSYSLFRYDTRTTESRYGTHLRTNTFYIYFIYYYEHIVTCYNKSLQNDSSCVADYTKLTFREYISTEFFSLGWIWVHYALFSLRNDYTIHYKLISCFLLFRYEQDNSYLANLNNQNNTQKEKVINVSIFWIGLDKIALLRFEHFYTFSSYEFLFCIPFFIHYWFKEDVKNLEQHKSDRSYSISMFSVFLHYYTSLLFIGIDVSDINSYNIYFLPFFGYSKKAIKTQQTGNFNIEEGMNLDSLNKTKTEINAWIPFIFRYSFEDDLNRIAILPLFIWNSDITFWVTIIRIVYNYQDSTFQLRFLYRLIFFTRNGQDKLLEINPFFNSEKKGEEEEWNILGGIVGNNNQKGCKICCCCFT